MYSNKGDLVPDELVVDLAKKRLTQPDVKEGYIFDGFPRTLNQADMLQNTSEELRPSMCVNIYIPEVYLIMKLAGRRVCSRCEYTWNVSDINEGEYQMPPLLPDDCKTCGGSGKYFIQREDDVESVVRQRLKVYEQETEPLVQYYTNLDMLLDFHVKKGVKDLPLLMQGIVTMHYYTRT
eukprot:GHVR01172543.1.p1 GENE.GHVR01172543.1~~GHVR01172543.1.p1  ORF type:complete len:179 (+),score=36.97 GHVR01172543.1:271-807(+)